MILFMRRAEFVFNEGLKIFREGIFDTETESFENGLTAIIFAILIDEEEQ